MFKHVRDTISQEKEGWLNYLQTDLQNPVASFLCSVFAFSAVPCPQFQAGPEQVGTNANVSYES